MTEINIRGVIIPNDDKWIYDWYEIESVSPKDVISQIKTANGEELTVIINSPGGDVYAGSDIYVALKEYKGNSVGKIVGVAASAASVAAMGTKKLLIAPTGQLMIHNVWSMVAGDYRTLEREAEVLKGHSAGIANAYILKTGMSQKELLDLMDKETYFNAQQALKYKFVDEIMFDEQSRLVASVKGGMLPLEVINKMRSMKAQIDFGNSRVDGERVKQSQARLNFLKLKGVKNYES